jgi:spore coat protein U-like protein
MTQPAARAVAAAVVLSIGLLLPMRRPVLAAGTSCAINSVTPVSFGAYDPMAAIDDDSVGNVKYTCNKVVTIALSLSGVQPNGARHMVSGSDTLLYNIFADAARTIVIGDGTNGASARLVNASSSQRTTQLYGRIPAGQDVGSGTYSTSLVLTFNF